VSFHALSGFFYSSYFATVTDQSEVFDIVRLGHTFNELKYKLFDEKWEVLITSLLYKKYTALKLTLILTFTQLCSLRIRRKKLQLHQLKLQNLQKKLLNLVASLISLPFQYNPGAGTGTYKGCRNTLIIQPVIPVSLSPKWNLITRVIIHLVIQHNANEEGTTQAGIGDAEASAFILPSDAKNGLVWVPSDRYFLSH
jgi:hypothetical protein